MEEQKRRKSLDVFSDYEDLLIAKIAECKKRKGVRPWELNALLNGVALVAEKYGAMGYISSDRQ